MTYFSLENAAIVKTCHQKKESNEGHSQSIVITVFKVGTNAICKHFKT